MDSVNFEIKYISAFFILALIALSTNLLTLGLNSLQTFYLSSRKVARKKEEVVVNKMLKSSMTLRQKRKNKYYVLINIYEKTSSVYSVKKNIDMKEQGEILTKFLQEKFLQKPKDFAEGFLYSFEEFEQIDEVLDVLFGVINSKAPITYAICVQVTTDDTTEDMECLNKLAKIKSTGKIYMISDTAYRYTYNNRKNYETSQIGVFQDGKNSMELHEFKKNIL